MSPRKQIFFFPMATVKNDNVVLWLQVDGDINFHRSDYRPKSKHTFSGDAQKRFKNALDNFANIFESSMIIKPSIFDYVGTDMKVHRRIPTFATFTVPDQNGKSDYFVKDEMFIPFKENLITNYGVNAYVWKAEAQLRGEIHFHCVFDRYLEENTLRKLWWKKLVENDCQGTLDIVEHASRIAWIQAAPPLSVLKLELSGYFAATETDEGKIVYKHDRTKEVRPIAGNSWGCSDNLRYRPMTLQYPDKNFELELARTCLDYFPIYEKDGDGKDIVERRRAEMFIYKKVFGFGENKQVQETKMNEHVKEALDVYHFNQGCKIYGGSQLTRSHEFLLYKNCNFDIVPASVEDYAASKLFNSC